MIGQSFTNMLSGPAENIARALGAPTAAAVGESRAAPLTADSSRSLFAAAAARAPTPAVARAELPAVELPTEFAAAPRPAAGGSGGMNNLLNLAQSFLGRSGAMADANGGASSGGGGGGESAARGPMPTLKQLLPGAARNFGFRIGDGRWRGDLCASRTTMVPF